MPKTYSPSEMRALLTGPVPSLTTPFHRDGRIDYDGLRRLIDVNLSHGAKTLMLTAGDSEYVLLSEQEIADVTKATIEHTAGRAMIIAADRYYNTAQAVEFARFAKEAGAHLYMALPPDWAGSCTSESLVEHYRAVGEIMPVMVVTNIFGPRGQKFGLETIEMVRDRVKSVVAVKDDLSGEFCRKLGLLVHDQWAIVSAGSKSGHLGVLPYGVDGHLSTFITLNPKHTRDYWKAVADNNLAEMRRVIRDHDIPFFDLILASKGGFDAGMHGALELAGLTQRWRRAPYYSLSDEEMEKLGSEFKKHRILS